MNVKTSDVKKRRTGAILAGVFVILFMILLLVTVIWANSEDPAPPIVLVVCFIIFGGIAVGVAVALIQRLKELKKGEIDEAGKY